MPGFSIWLDPLLGLITYAISVSLTLAWVSRPDQTQVEVSTATSRRVILRIGMIVLALLGICYMENCTFLLPLGVIAVSWLIILIPDLGIVGFPMIILSYLAKEFVLGFPELILSSRSRSDISQQNVAWGLEYVGQSAIASLPLKPLGKVRLGDEEFSAASEMGAFIDQGTTVVVVGIKDNSLLVQPCDI